MQRIPLIMASALMGSLAAGTTGAQQEHHMMSQATDVKLDVRDNAAARVLTVRLGPLNLPAHSDHMAVAQAPDLFLSVPFDGWITAYHPRLVDDAGRRLPHRLLHHVGFWNTARPDFLCPKKLEHIFGAGGEMNNWAAVPGVGYRVAKGERIRISTMFHNPTDTSFPKVYLLVRMEYQPLLAVGPVLKSVYPTWFDVMECNNSGYDLKPGNNVTTGDFTIPYSGTLLGVGGHLHDYGRQLRLVNTTRNKDIATLNSKLDVQGHLLSMPVVYFTRRGGYRLDKGEVVKATATYDNPTGKLLPEGAMGIVVGYFLPDHDQELAALSKSRD